MGSPYQEDLAYIQAVAFGEEARGAAPEILRRLRAARCPIRHVLDVGCGAGPLTQLLIAAEFEVTGIDRSPELLSLARAVAPTANYINASIHAIELPACDAIVAVGEPLTYYEEDDYDDVLISRFFRRASTVLPVGGVLIFDVIECGAPSLTGRFCDSGEDWAVLADIAENPATRTLVRDIETFRKVGELYRRGREVHRVRLFDTARLCQELAACGFEVETAQHYGERSLPPRRRAFFASLVGSSGSKR